MKEILSTVPFLLSYSMPLSVFIGFTLHGVWCFLTVFIIAVFHPILDFFLTPEKPTEDREKKINHKLGAAILNYYPLLQTTLLVWCLFFIADSANPFWEKVLITYSFGFTAGAVGITAAHEFIHRKEKWKRFLGVTLLSQVLYAHYRIEHIHGHHMHVATPLDAATARKGEHLAAFWFRSVVDGFKHSWNFENKKSKSWTSNRMLHYVLIQSAILIAVTIFFGILGFLFFISQSFIAVTLLETVNYMEHYGLERKEIGPGVYEGVKDEHTWDTGHRLTNWFVFNLGKHSHHHREASKNFPDLKLLPEARRLKFGYSQLLLKSLLGYTPAEESGHTKLFNRRNQ